MPTQRRRRVKPSPSLENVMRVVAVTGWYASKQVLVHAVDPPSASTSLPGFMPCGSQMR
jgi:hypothetical protein